MVMYAGAKLVVNVALLYPAQGLSCTRDGSRARDAKNQGAPNMDPKSEDPSCKDLKTGSPD